MTRPVSGRCGSFGHRSSHLRVGRLLAVPARVGMVGGRADGPPDEVVIVDCGFDDWVQVQTATRILAEAGIAFAVRQSTYLGYGAARNAAVRVTSAEWVIHLDVDDRLFSWAIADTLALTAAATWCHSGHCIGVRRDASRGCLPSASSTRNWVLLVRGVPP